MQNLTLDAGLVAIDNDGLEEFVVLALLVALLDGSQRVAAGLTLAQNHTLQGKLNTLPSLVTVHGIVATNNGGQLTNSKLLELAEELLHVAVARLGVRVATIAEEVNVDLGDLGSLGSLEQGVKVLLLGVLLQNRVRFLLYSVFARLFIERSRRTTPP